MENDDVASPDSVTDPADVSRLPWWRRPPLPAIVAVAAVVALVYWMASDDAFEFSDLELLPKDSSYVVVVNVDAVYSSELGELIRDAFSDQIRKAEGEMREEVAFVPEDLSYFVVGGNVDASAPVIILAFEDEPDDAQIAKLVQSVCRQDVPSAERDGHRVWKSESRRMAMLEIRDGTFLIGLSDAVDHALAVLDSGGSNDIADLMADQDLLESPAAAVFDWRTIKEVQRQLPRGLEGVAAAMAKHIGPILVKAQVDDGVAAEWTLLNTDDDIVMRATMEIDGDFLEELIRDLARLAR